MVNRKIKVIQNYINGESTDPYTIEWLENNKNFMLSVLKCTKDKNMYNLCSEDLKHSSDFIREVIRLFENNPDFAISIGEEYVKNEPLEEERAKILFALQQVTEKKQDYKKSNIKYSLKLHAIYIKKRLEIKAVKESPNIAKNPELLSEIGMGFQYLEDCFDEELIKNFIAPSMINEIFYSSENIDLEQKLHTKLSKKEIDKLNINVYLLRIIESYDKELYYYVSNNLELLNAERRKINRIKSNWDNYNKNQIQNIGDQIYKFVADYIDENQKEFPFLAIETIYLISKELGKLKVIEAYDKQMLNNPGFKQTTTPSFMSKSEMSFIELSHYNKLKKVMKKIYNQNLDSEENKDNIIKKCKVYTFHKKQSNN